MTIAGFVLAALLFAALPAHAVVGDATAAALWVNALGLDILGKTAPGGNALLSPYSIEMALAMAFDGAAGVTREEIRHVLHYDQNDTGNEPYISLQELPAFFTSKAERATKEAKARGDSAQVTFVVANQLFAQQGFVFHQRYLDALIHGYHAPLQSLDFVRKPDDSRRAINLWVEDHTRKRIRDLIPPGGVTKDTRLALVNALYLKASWAIPFPKESTQSRPFHLSNGKTVNVPTMRAKVKVGYDQRGFHAIAIPYVGGELLFVILLPDEKSNVAALEKTLTPELLTFAKNAPVHQITVEIPKFKLEPPVMPLADTMKALGMKTAFDPVAANFDSMSTADLCLSAIYHKTFLSLDEAGTEAAAATAIMVSVTSMPPPREIKIDRPFLFAIQDRESGACLFLGRMMDPR